MMICFHCNQYPHYRVLLAYSTPPLRKMGSPASLVTCLAKQGTPYHVVLEKAWEGRQLLPFGLFYRIYCYAF